MSVSKLRKFITEEPVRPAGIIPFRKPILISDSKGYTLRNYCPDYKFPFELWCLSGAKTKKLVNLLEERTEKVIKRYSNVVFYFWSGTCDVTIKKGNTYI